MVGLDDADTLSRLKLLRSALIEPAIDEHGGRLVQTAGDSFLVVFDSIDGALRCALKVQRLAPAYDGAQPPERRIRFRIGVEIGDIIPTAVTSTVMESISRPDCNPSVHLAAYAFRGRFANMHGRALTSCLRAWARSR
jgi:class 3 adenylate cyclase